MENDGWFTNLLVKHGDAPLRKLPTYRKLPCISLGAGGELGPRQLEIATAVWQKTLRFLMDSKPQRRYLKKQWNPSKMVVNGGE